MNVIGVGIASLTKLPSLATDRKACVVLRLRAARFGLQAKKRLGSKPESVWAPIYPSSVQFAACRFALHFSSFQLLTLDFRLLTSSSLSISVERLYQRRRRRRKAKGFIRLSLLALIKPLPKQSFYLPFGKFHAHVKFTCVQIELLFHLFRPTDFPSLSSTDLVRCLPVWPVCLFVWRPG